MQTQNFNLLLIFVRGRLMCFRPRRSLKSLMPWVTHLNLCTDSLSCLLWDSEQFCSPLQMLSFMRAQYTLFQQGFHILDEIDPYMKKLAAQVKPTPTNGKYLTEPGDCFHFEWPPLLLPDVFFFCCCVQLDQLVIDSAVEKRELEHKHALIQQRVRQQTAGCTVTTPHSFNNSLSPLFLSRLKQSNCCHLWNNFWSQKSSGVIYFTKVHIL